VEPLSDSEFPPLRPSWPERALSLLATVAVGLLCALVTLGVVSRLVGRPLVPDNVLLVQEMMVAVILLPLAVVTVLREHIAVTVFTRRAGARTQRLLAVLGHLVGLVFSGALLWASARLLSRSLASGEYYYGALDIPVWTGHAMFVVGAAAFTLRLLVMLAIDLLAVLRR
jgi:TRAP-type C4-dicarboxylate transport system permease small subunit